MYHEIDEESEEDEELEPRVRYSVILQKEDYVEEEEEDPEPYADDGPGYYFFLST